MEIVWVPERVGHGRRFRVIVKSATPVSCDRSDALVLLDRTPELSRGPQHRFHFRATMPMSRAEIRFTSAQERNTVTVPIIAESDWDRPARLGEIELPRVWPLGVPFDNVGLKTRHTLVSPDDIGKDRDTWPPPPDEITWSDEELWSLEPPCDIPRWHFLNLDRGCPAHGLQIYHSDPYYPWIVDVRNHPYQVQCPVGGEWYPTNDYLNGDHTSGEHPDDGWGWHAPDGAIFGFISYYLLRRIRFVYGVVKRLADYFFATGDPVAARKVAVLLVTLAREHRYLSFFPEHRFRRYEEVVEEPAYRERKDRISYGPRETKKVANLGNGSGMDDYCINLPYHYDETARAYDLVFDRIDGDAELIAFVRSKLPELADGPAIRRYIEVFHFRNAAQVGLDDAMMSNLPRPQMAMLNIVRVLDQPECSELVRWLTEGGGQLGRMARNFYYKDGAPYESTGGYNGIHISALVPIVEGLRKLREHNPNLYAAPQFDPIESHERYRHILRWPVEIVVGRLSYPLIGDTGGVPDSLPLVPTPVMDMGDSLAVYESAVRSFPHDRQFRAVAETLRRKEQATKRARERGEQGAAGFYGRPPEAEVRPDARLALPSRLLDGYGVGILESGEPPKRRGIWLYYGDHPGHSHEQVMDIGLFAHRRNLLRHMGYPYSWQHMDTWDASWITHFSVKVVPSKADADEPWWRNTVRLFHGRGGFQIVEALGYGITRRRGEEGCLARPGHRLRRTVALVDLPDGRFYAVDSFRVDGGEEHWWTFHGLPGKLEISSATHLESRPGGTVASQQIEYAHLTPRSIPKSLAYLYDVKRGEAKLPWSATWDLEKSEGLKLKITQVWPEGGELVFARGRSPHAPKENPPYELDWALRHRKRAKGGRKPLASEFITIIESDASLPVTGAQAIAQGPVTGVRVTAAGLTHWVLRGDGGVRVHEVEGDVQFAGRAGFVEVDGFGIRRMTLLGEGMLTWRGLGIQRGAPDWTGVIAEVDAAARRIVVAAESPPPHRLVGEYLLIVRPFGGKDDHDSFAYRIEGVESAGVERWALGLNWSPLISDGRVGEQTNVGFRAPGQCPLALARSYFRGAYLVNYDGSTRARLNDIQGGWGGTEMKIVFAPEYRSLIERFPVNTEYRVEEIGVGDRVVYRGWTELSRRGDGTWLVESSGTAEVIV